MATLEVLQFFSQPWAQEPNFCPITEKNGMKETYTLPRTRLKWQRMLLEGACINATAQNKHEGTDTCVKFLNTDG